MSVTYIPMEMRQFVVERAEGLCEYCLIAEEDTFFGCQLDHIISEKHGGPTIADNLANCCLCCNQAKGSDVGSIDWDTGEFVRFYNPRSDVWAQHFRLVEVSIVPLTKIGRVTSRILAFNRADRVMERLVLQKFKRYPTSAALNRMRTANGKA